MAYKIYLLMFSVILGCDQELTSQGKFELKTPFSIKGIVPAKASAGTPITISGTGLTHIQGAQLGGLVLSNLVVQDDNTITAVVPDEAPLGETTLDLSSGESRVALPFFVVRGTEDLQSEVCVGEFYQDELGQRVEGTKECAKDAPKSFDGSSCAPGQVLSFDPEVDQNKGGWVCIQPLREKIVNAGYLADGAVTTAKLQTRAVTKEKLAVGAVGLEALADMGCVSGELLKWQETASGGAWVCMADLNAGGVASVTSAEISDGTIHDADIAVSAGIQIAKIAGLSTALSSKENAFGSGSTGQYLRGDKSWQTLDTSVVSENGSLYFTAARARAAAVADQLNDGETGTAPSQNAVFDALALKADASSLGGLAALSSVGSSEVTDGSLVDADIAATAAIAHTKIAGLGSLATASSVGSLEIGDGEILDQDIAATAAISGSKINPDFGAQSIVTTGTISGDGSGLTNLPSGALGTSIDSSEIVNGEILDEDIAATAAISGSKVNPDFGSQNIVTTGTISGDGSGLTNLPSGALGTSIDSSEIEDGAILDADISATAAIAISKIAGLGSLATKSAVASSDITDGEILDVDIAATAAIAGSKINPDFGSQNITTTGIITGDGSGLTNLPAGSLGTSIDSSEIVDGAILDADISASAAIANSKIAGLGSLATKSSVNSSDITDGAIGNADIASSAAILGTKIYPDFGAQNIVTTGSITGDGSSLTNLSVDSSEIEDGAIVDADISSSANINVAKISGLGNLATRNEVDSTTILDESISNADISITADISGTKINPDFGNKSIETTATLTLGTQLNLKPDFPGKPGDYCETASQEDRFAIWRDSSTHQIQACVFDRVVTIAGYHLIFLSSETYNGDLGGLSGADETCQDLAYDAGLPRHDSYKAFLSGGGSMKKITDRIRIIGPVINTNKETIAQGRELFVVPLQALVRYDESGTIVSSDNTVWTGGKTNNWGAADHCTNWTVTSGQGGTGNSLDSVEWFSRSSGASTSCSDLHRIYCISQ